MKNIIIFIKTKMPLLNKINQGLYSLYVVRETTQEIKNQTAEAYK